MPLDRRFVRAEIIELGPQTHKLTITYSWYNAYNYNTVWVYKTREDAIRKLAVVRCDSGSLTVRDAKGDPVEIEPPGG